MNNVGYLIRGKEVADSISAALMKEVIELKTRNIEPKLKIIRVGTQPSDLAYERGAIKRCESIGIVVEVEALPSDINQEEFINVLKSANNDDSVNGILIFRPFPKQLDENVIKQYISPEKDVDCFSQINVAKVMENDTSGYPPCTPAAVMEMLRYNQVRLDGKKVAVVGRSMVIGKPVALMLLSENSTVTICHSKTKRIEKICSDADVLVVGIGKAKMITAEYVKKGAIVIDVGINVDKMGNVCGDVDLDDCISKASLITPVPGGVGSVTTSVLAKHVIKACISQNDKE